MRYLLFLFVCIVIANTAIAHTSSAEKSILASTHFKSFDEIILKDSLQASDCQIRDITDILSAKFAKKRAKKHKPAKEEKEKKVSLLILPSFSVNPANGVMFGVNSNAAWHFGSKETTRLSTANAKVVYTTNKQLMAYLKTALYTRNDKYFLEGDFKYYIYSLPTYGVGTNAPDTAYDAAIDWQDVEHAGGGGSYPMDYNFIIFHQIVNRKIRENIYAGVGYQLDTYWNIEDKLLNIDTIPQQLTPHYTYSTLYDINPKSYSISGFSLNLMYDSRDNMLSPYKGYYAKINFRYNSKLLGSSTETTELFLEFRTYIGIDKAVPRKLIAFWFLSSFQLSGHTPYFTLSALGDDQKGNSGRGYVAGRYRGESIMYGEVEYRFPFNKCNQTIGGVVFLNATTASNATTGVQLFEYVRPAIGFGVRILMNKSVRLNIMIDYAVGYKSQGFYFNSGDAF